MTNRQKKIALYSILALALLAVPASFSLAQDSFEDLKKAHEQYDFDALRKRGEELSQQAQSGQLLGAVTYSERGASLRQSYAPAGRLSEVSISAEAVEGQTTKNDLDAGYLPGTTLEIEGRLTVAKGSYKAEFKNQGQVLLTLEAVDGSSAEGKALVPVDAQGKLPFEITANQAEDVAMTLTIKVPGSDVGKVESGGSAPASAVNYSHNASTSQYLSNKVSVNCNDSDVRDALRDIASQIGKKLNASSTIAGRVTLELTDVPLQEALDQLLAGQRLDSFVDISQDELQILPLAPADLRNKSLGNTEIYRSIERTNVP